MCDEAYGDGHEQVQPPLSHSALPTPQFSRLAHSSLPSLKRQKPQPTFLSSARSFAHSNRSQNQQQQAGHAGGQVQVRVSGRKAAFVLAPKHLPGMHDPGSTQSKPVSSARTSLPSCASPPRPSPSGAPLVAMGPDGRGGVQRILKLSSTELSRSALPAKRKPAKGKAHTAPRAKDMHRIDGMPRLPADVLDSLHRNGVGLKGGLATPVGGGVSSLNMRLRQELDLFANLVFCHDIPIGTKRPHHHGPATTPSSHAHADESSHERAESNAGELGAGAGAGEQGQGHARRDVAEALRRRPQGVNIVVVRENTEGEYSGLEHEVVPGVVESLKVVSKFCSERIARYAFQYAYLNGRRAVTAVHKANVMKVSDGLFLDSCRQVAQSYPQLRYSEIIVDNCCMQLVRRPQQFDVMVTPNLYGSLVANTAAGICGGSYLMPGGNVGDNAAVFEQGASAGNVGNERMVSERTANPTALLLSAAMMLHHLHLPVFADRVEGAVKGVLAEGTVLTPDMGGRATTQDMVDAIVDRLG
ncbi:unnamed protein product [Closterium sp. Yama58-4]|nr:unnamed protein product [Closterium sp. Yama58-4]